jgi:hypothetical protein
VRCGRRLIVAQVVQKDKAAQDKLPEVMKQRLQNKPNERSLPNQPPKGSRSYSTSMTPLEPSGVLDTALLDFKPPTTMPQIPGLKFEAPVLPIPKDAHVKHRYDPVVEQVTNLLMRHGKKSVAQRVWNITLPTVDAANSAKRIWHSFCSISARRPSPPLTQPDHSLLAHPRHPIFL